MVAKTYTRYRKPNTHVRNLPPAPAPDLCTNCQGSANCRGCAGDPDGCAKCIPFRAGACSACDGTGATL